MKNYYSDFNLPRFCTFEDIAVSFRQLALEHRNSPLLHKYCEAYEVLSDPQRRKLYDEHGENFFQEDFTVGTRKIGGYKYKNNAREIFENFFGTCYPFIYDYQGAIDKRTSKPPNDIIVEVPCTLEELYIGCRKTVEYSTSKEKNLWKTLEIPEKCEYEYKIVFYGEGDDSEEYPKSNLIFMPVEIPHSHFVRQGRNLLCTVTISLIHALCALPIEIETLDKKKFMVSYDKVIENGSEKVIKGKGFTEKGSLIVRTYVEFPKHIKSEDKEKLIELLTQ